VAKRCLSCKTNSDGTREWGTYYGGAFYEEYCSIAIDNSNNIYLCGMTESTSQISTIGAFQTSLAGSSDCFVVKFDPSGLRQWGTYYGGIQTDNAKGITADINGDIIFIGNTESSSGLATSGAFLTSGNFTSGLLVKLSPSGSRKWATYFDAYNWRGCTSVASDKWGNIYFTGNTDLPGNIATTGAHQTSLGGGVDAFLQKFDSTGNRIWGTYYGGMSEDYGIAVATDTLGNVYLGGYTNSSSGISTPGSLQPNNGDPIVPGWVPRDSYLAKFNASGTRIYGTYYGVINDDILCGVATFKSGTACITGSSVGSSSSSGGLPLMKTAFRVLVMLLFYTMREWQFLLIIISFQVRQSSVLEVLLPSWDLYRQMEMIYILINGYHQLLEQILVLQMLPG
jgi:hypothetical protein